LSLQQGWVSNGLFDAKFGSSFVKNDLIIGVSVPRIMQSTANLENDAFIDYLQYRRNRTFQLYLANKYTIGKQLQLWPSLLLSTQKQQTNIDFSTMAIISKNLIIGGGYHYKYGVSATVGLLMNNGLRLAYNFTMPGNEIGAVANGHEIALGYTFKLSKKETEKHKSPKSNVVQKSIEQQFLELDLENVVQKEALTRLKNQIKGTDIETTIESIKTASKMLLESSNSNANYFLVYGSFSSLENASKYQQTLSRYSSKLSSKIIEDHGVFMVYLENTRDQKTAFEILKNKEEITLSTEEKWIYVKVE